MSNEPRTFQLDRPPMKGKDIQMWQNEVVGLFKKLDLQCPLHDSGVYDVATRSFTATLCHALGMNATNVMRNGLTPQLRTRLRNRDLTKTELKAFNAREDWRRDLRARWTKHNVLVHRPVTHIIADSWGFHKGVHDGLDVIAEPNAVAFAMIRSKVIDVRSGGWWGKGAPANPSVKARGGGIVQLEILDTIGPFVKGRHIGYGHVERARVKVGQEVHAGQPIAQVGLANAWHIHLMYNHGNTDQGVGEIDPRKILDYSVKHG